MNILVIVTDELVNATYNAKTYKANDFDKKRRSHSVIGIIKTNTGNLDNIKSPKDFKINFDTFKGYEEDAFNILTQAIKIIKDNNLNESIPIEKIRRIIHEESNL